MFEWERYRQGTLRLRVTGGWIERFINRLLLAGIGLRQIQTDGKATFFWVKLGDYRRLCTIAKDSRVRVRIVEKRGCPFVAWRLRKRKGLVIGPLLFGVILYLCTLFVWQVEVIGNRTVETDKILALAKEEHITIGALRSAIRTRDAQEAILAGCGQLVWCGIRQEGARVVIEVVEKTPRRSNADVIGDLTAGKEAVITELIVLRGTAVKAVGDLVQKGEVLVAGIEPNDTEEDAVDPETTRTVGASAIVRARVRYEGYGEASLETIRPKRTGNTAYGLTICTGERVLDWRSEAIEGFRLWETDKTAWQWRNQFFPVEIITDIYYECEPITEVISVEEARAIATEKAWQAITEKIPQDAQITDRTIETVQDESAKCVQARAVAETEEEIGIYPARVSRAEE